MSSYIIAGSSDNPDTAYCEEVAKKIKAKYSNIDFRIIIKHPSEWDSHLQEVCRIYGFRNKSNPIIYTFDGKIIGDKQAFLRMTGKYFGIGEKDMQIGPISVDVNKKQADEELRKKLKLKRQQKTLLESIDLKIEEKLKEKVFSHKLYTYDKSVENCLVLYQRKVDGLCHQMEFPVDRVVQSHKEEIHPDEELDLMAMSLRDQIHVPEEALPHAGAIKDKEAFVTHQEESGGPGELRRSKTNGSVRLHESSLSHENQSKHSSAINRQNRENNNKTQVEQQFFEQSRYYELFNIENYIVSDLGDEFYLVFNSKPVILGQLEIVKIAPTQEGLFQMDYTKNPREQKGHAYKQPHPPTQQMIEEITTKQIVDMEKPPGSKDDLKEEEDKASIDNEVKEQKKDDQPKQTISIRGEDNNLFNNLEVQEEFEVELESNINARVLNFMKPLSILEIKKIYQVLSQTSAVATIQYSQTNPNPKVVINLRKYINEATQHIKNKSTKLPIEATIMDFIGDVEIVKDGVGFIRTLGYMHLIVKTPPVEAIPELIKKLLTILVQLQNSLNKVIGYNLILAPEYIMIVPLIDSYQTYNNQHLYVDGLAYIGIVHIAKTNSPFAIKKPEQLKSFSYLTKCAGTVELAEKLK